MPKASNDFVPKNVTRSGKALHWTIEMLRGLVKVFDAAHLSAITLVFKHGSRVDRVMQWCSAFPWGTMIRVLQDQLTHLKEITVILFRPFNDPDGSFRKLFWNHVQTTTVWPYIQQGLVRLEIQWTLRKVSFYIT
jgi:hypothetical protein